MTDVQQDARDPIVRAVIECAADAIVAVDDRFAVTVWNPAAERMFGFAAAEVLGRVAPIVPDELQAEHNAVRERIREGGQISKVTRRFHKDGRLIDVRIDTSALRSASGALLGGVLTDLLSWRWIFYINIPVAAVAVIDAQTRLVMRLTSYIGTRPVQRHELRDVTTEVSDFRVEIPCGLPVVEETRPFPT